MGYGQVFINGKHFQKNALLRKFSTKRGRPFLAATGYKVKLLSTLQILAFLDL